MMSRDVFTPAGLLRLRRCLVSLLCVCARLSFLSLVPPSLLPLTHLPPSPHFPRPDLPHTRIPFQTVASLDRFVNDAQKKPLMLVEGEPGSGKSALLANFISQHTDAHPGSKVGPLPLPRPCGLLPFTLSALFFLSYHHMQTHFLSRSLQRHNHETPFLSLHRSLVLSPILSPTPTTPTYRLRHPLRSCTTLSAATRPRHDWAMSWHPCSASCSPTGEGRSSLTTAWSLPCPRHSHRTRICRRRPFLSSRRRYRSPASSLHTGLPPPPFVLFPPPLPSPFSSRHRPARPTTTRHARSLLPLSPPWPRRPAHSWTTHTRPTHQTRKGPNAPTATQRRSACPAFTLFLSLYSSPSPPP